jgi:mannose-6-phosphate isomerase-like protein (cupin superfamily)
MGGMSSVGPFSLDTDPVHLSGALRNVPIEGFDFTPDAFMAYIGAHCSDDDPGRIAMIEHSPEPWGAWECHHDGDELVIVTSGVALFVQEIDGEHVQQRVTAGQAIINPRGVWHTADVEQPFSAVYLTPCPGTEHRPR